MPVLTLSAQSSDALAGITKQLRVDYPERALDWLADVSWEKPQLVPLDQIEYTDDIFERIRHHERDKVATFAKRIQNGWRKAVILIKRPSGLLKPIDGHTRISAYHKINRPAWAWVGTVKTQKGPWDSFHKQQLQTVNGQAFDLLEFPITVRTAAGVRFYRQPIGSIVYADSPGSRWTARDVDTPEILQAHSHQDLLDIRRDVQQKYERNTDIVRKVRAAVVASRNAGRKAGDTPTEPTPTPPPAPSGPKIDYDGLSPADRKRLDDAIAIQRHELPDLAKVKEIRIVPGLVKGRGENGHYENGILSFDPRIFTDESRSWYLQGEDNGYHVKTGADPIAYEVAHEMGHALIDQVSNHTELERVSAEAYPGIKSFGVVRPNFGKVSHYGGTSHGEGLAEIWAEHTLGSSPRPESEKVAAKMKELAGYGGGEAPAAPKPPTAPKPPGDGYDLRQGSGGSYMVYRTGGTSPIGIVHRTRNDRFKWDHADTGIQGQGTYASPDAAAKALLIYDKGVKGEATDIRGAGKITFYKAMPESRKQRFRDEIQKVQDTQAKLIPAIVNHANVIVTPIGENTNADYLAPVTSNMARIRITPSRLGRGLHNTENGWHTQGDGETLGQHTLAHEYGHGVHYALADDNRRNGIHGSTLIPTDPKLWNDIARELGLPAPKPNVDGNLTFGIIRSWIETYQRAFERAVSRYGATSPQELLADLWSEYSSMVNSPEADYISAVALIYGEYAMRRL